MNLALIRVALRGFFIQCTWNFERMQNVGFAFAIAPALKRLYPDKEQRLKALRRHMDFFNTHPYMANLVLGSAIKVEEDCLKSGEDPGQKVAALKLGLMGPLAAMGDSLFWANLRPLAALLAVAGAWMAPQTTPLFSLGLYLLIFNLPHLALRLSSLWQGHMLGFEVAPFLKKLDPQGIIASLRLAALVVLGATLACFGRFVHPASGAKMPLGDNFAFIGAGLVMLLALRLGVSVIKILAACCLVSLVLSMSTFNHP